MTETMTLGELIEGVFAALPMGGSARVEDARAGLRDIHDLIARYGLQRLKARAVVCKGCGTDITLEALWKDAKECDECRERRRDEVGAAQASTDAVPSSAAPEMSGP